uniref:THO complex subunit 7 n=1 Tax=Laticauda laticaudata TaxID=8630 RepID=A0A8C5SGI9_LATLA
MLLHTDWCNFYKNNIAAAHEKIAECKKQILQAKRIRKNRQEYDNLAKIIQQHPDRHETLKQLEALGKELQHLSHIKESVEDKLELRRKQFHVLLSTIHELQQTLESKLFHSIHKNIVFLSLPPFYISASPSKFSLTQRYSEHLY